MKKIISLVLVLCMAITLCSCNKSAENGAQSINSENEIDSNSCFIVQQTVYESEKLVLKCENITTDGIKFECTNKLDEEINIYLTIGLDGIYTGFWSESSDTTIDAGQTKEFTMNGTVKNCEHAVMSVMGTVFADSGSITFDVCDFNLGGSENKESLPDGEVQYSSDDLTVEYVGADAQGVNFKVQNNRKVGINVGFDTFTINGEDDDYAITVEPIPAHTTGIYSVDILSYNENYFSNDLKSFEGTMKTFIDGEGIIDRFPIQYGDSVSAANDSKTYEAYLEATTLNKSQLTATSLGKYFYGDYAIVDEDEDWLKNTLNTTGSINQGALYRSFAKGLDCFDTVPYSMWGEKYCEVIWGISKPNEPTEIEPLIADTNKFITRSDSFLNILKKLNSLESVSGSFDFDKMKIDFSIQSLTDTSAELGITEQMLGYTLAMLDEYAPTINFDGNSYTFSYSGFNVSSVEPLSENDYIISSATDGKNVNVLQALKDEYGSGSFIYYYYDPSVDSDKKGIIETNRGIYIGASKSDVIFAYGQSDSLNFNKDSNELYTTFVDNGMDDAAVMRTQCVTYYSYFYDDIGHIDFYFDDDDEVSWIVFYYD